MKDNEAYVRIAQFVESHPDLTYAELGKALGLTCSQVSRIARLQGVKRGPGKRSASLIAAVAAIEAFGQKPECELAEPTVPSADQATPAAPDLAPADVLELQ
jgi:hypothetical protein